MADYLHPLDLLSWQRSFYLGNRLQAEVELLASFFSAEGVRPDLEVGCALLHSSYGAATKCSPLSPFQCFQELLPEPKGPADSRAQYLLAPDCPDSLLLWALIRHLPTTGDIGGERRLHMLRRTALLLLQGSQNVQTCLINSWNLSQLDRCSRVLRK